MGSEPATWCGLVGGLTERERGTVCAGGRLPYCAERVAEGRFQPLVLSTGLGRRMFHARVRGRQAGRARCSVCCYSGPQVKIADETEWGS